MSSYLRPNCAGLSASARSGKRAVMCLNASESPLVSRLLDPPGARFARGGRTILPGMGAWVGRRASATMPGSRPVASAVDAPVIDANPAEVMPDVSPARAAARHHDRAASSRSWSSAAGSPRSGSNWRPAGCWRPISAARRFIWASLIGLTLTFLALGYYLGGLLADRQPDPQLLYLL